MCPRTPGTTKTTVEGVILARSKLTQRKEDKLRGQESDLDIPECSLHGGVWVCVCVCVCVRKSAHHALGTSAVRGLLL